MPTVFTHPVVAVGLAPWFRRAGVTGPTLAVGAACTVVPDLDVIGFWFGIPYGAMLGHRGLTHSLPFAAALAAFLVLVLRRLSTRKVGISSFVFLFLCTASHGLLDAMTNGGLGVAFFAPFSGERYFLPWQPIQVSPLSIARFFSGAGWPVLRSEFVWVVLPSLAFGGAAWLVRKRRV